MSDGATSDFESILPGEMGDFSLVKKWLRDRNHIVNVIFTEQVTRLTPYLIAVEVLIVTFLHDMVHPSPVTLKISGDLPLGD
jgi:hypothetical protein